MYQQTGKRLLDFSLALFGILISAPIWGFLLVFMAIHHRGNPLFRQPRPGRFGRVFWLFKFKTMTDKRDLNGHLLPDNDRITPMGAWLRRTSLDELPQLFNVLLGDMSLVGPRPLLVDYWPLYSPDQRCRHNVRPGLTGWVQVNGRNALSWDEKFALDNWYVTHYSFWLDLKILGLTVAKIVLSRSHNQLETKPMPRFTGATTL